MLLSCFTGQFVAAMSPNPMVASILFATFFSFVFVQSFLEVRADC